MPEMCPARARDTRLENLRTSIPFLRQNLEGIDTKNYTHKNPEPRAYQSKNAVARARVSFSETARLQRQASRRPCVRIIAVASDGHHSHTQGR